MKNWVRNLAAHRYVNGGGRMTMAKSPIPTVGVLIRFVDTEGNEVGAMKYDTPPSGGA